MGPLYRPVGVIFTLDLHALGLVVGHGSGAELGLGHGRGQAPPIINRRLVIAVLALDSLVILTAVAVLAAPMNKAYMSILVS